MHDQRQLNINELLSKNGLTNYFLVQVADYLINNLSLGCIDDTVY